LLEEETLVDALVASLVILLLQIVAEVEVPAVLALS
jgi:hypothetical protein